MSQDISKDDFEKFRSRYPQLANIGINHLGPKIWILFNALRNDSVSVTSISHKPCASLMENGVSFDDIQKILNELRTNGLMVVIRSQYHLKDDIAYVLQQLSFDLTRELPSSGKDMDQLLLECGYSTEFRKTSFVSPLFSDDNNAKTNRFKELLSEVAFSGLKLIIKLIE